MQARKFKCVAISRYGAYMVMGDASSRSVRFKNNVKLLGFSSFFFTVKQIEYKWNIQPFPTDQKTIIKVKGRYYIAINTAIEQLVMSSLVIL